MCLNYLQFSILSFAKIKNNLKLIKEITTILCLQRSTATKSFKSFQVAMSATFLFYSLGSFTMLSNKKPWL